VYKNYIYKTLENSEKIVSKLRETHEENLEIASLCDVIHKLLRDCVSLDYDDNSSEDCSEVINIIAPIVGFASFLTKKYYEEDFISLCEIYQNARIRVDKLIGQNTNMEENSSIPEDCERFASENGQNSTPTSSKNPACTMQFKNQPFKMGDTELF